MAAFPIRNDEDLDHALERIEALWAADPGTPEGDKLDVLLVLVQDYEVRHHALPAGDPVEVVRYKMEELDLSQRELARRLGWGSGRVSEVLDRKRQLTLAMVRQLASVLGIAPGLLVGEERPIPLQAADVDRPVSLPPGLMSAVREAAAREGCTADTWVAQILRHAYHARSASADQGRGGVDSGGSD